MVLSTVVPTFFTGVDSFDKTRFSVIAGHPSLLLREITSVGRKPVEPLSVPRDLVKEEVAMCNYPLKSRN